MGIHAFYFSQPVLYFQTANIESRAVPGKLPLAQAYVEASEEARLAIVAIYEWQRLTTAILFDVFGFFLLSVWIFVGSVAGLRSGGLPKGISWFGVVAALLSFSFATGYITKIVSVDENFGLTGRLSAVEAPFSCQKCTFRLRSTRLCREIFIY
jgi:hypothetical protein